jgi:hypothetical protein
VAVLPEFADVAELRGNTYWFRPKDAIRVIEAARRKSVRLLGFDAAFLTKHSTQPSMADSWDYSVRSTAVNDPYTHAIGFIRERTQHNAKWLPNKEIFFEIVLEENSE